MSSFFRKLTWWRERRRREDELREELQFHLAEEADERQSGGLSKDEAALAARRDLGNVTLVREEARTLWSWLLLEQLAQDLRYGLRAMAASKTFSAMAILSLALGIGANTAIFSFMDAILLRALPVPDPQSLVILSWHTPERDMHGTNRHDDSFTDPDGGFVGGFFAYQAFELFRQNDSVFSTVFGYQGAAGDVNLTVRGEAGLARTEYVSGDYFRGLGIPPAAGRLIGADDDRAGAPGTAVVSFALEPGAVWWTRECGRPIDPDQQHPVYRRRRHSAGILRRRSRPAAGRVCPDARERPSRAAKLLSRDLPRSLRRLGRADGAPASRGQREAGTGGAGRSLPPMGPHARTRSGCRRTSRL